MDTNIFAHPVELRRSVNIATCYYVETKPLQNNIIRYNDIPVITNKYWILIKLVLFNK
jgi:hypothetical protein